jgi:hypothetical protein
MLRRVKKQWLPRAWMIFNVLSLLYIVISDFVFALYVNNVPMTYTQFDAYRITVDNISFILLFPASLFLWRFLKLRDWSVKKAAGAYILYGILAPFLFLPSFASRYGQISWEYTAFSSTVLSNLSFKLMMLVLLLLVVWPLLIGALFTGGRPHERQGLLPLSGRRRDRTRFRQPRGRRRVSFSPR